MVRLDTRTGVMTVFDVPYAGTAVTLPFRGGVFDGRSVWLVPGNSAALVRDVPYACTVNNSFCGCVAPMLWLMRLVLHMR